MPLLTVALSLIVVGVLLWLVNTFIPMQRSIKSILNAVVVHVVPHKVTQRSRIVEPEVDGLIAIARRKNDGRRTCVAVGGICIRRR